MESEAATCIMEFSFSDLPVAKQVVIVETSHPGAVTKITAVDITGKKHLIYKGAQEKVEATSRIKSYPVPASVKKKLKTLRIEMKTLDYPGWHQLDAVGLTEDPNPVTEIK